MKREDLTTLCRYYHGEEVSPYEGKDQNKSMLWFYESCWVVDMIASNTGKSSGIIEEYVGEYLRAGLLEFRKNDSVPLSLKAFLFNRYMKGSMDGNPEPFKAFYSKYY